MTDEAPTDQATEPEVINGIPLQHDAALIPRTPEIHLPALSFGNGKVSSWELIPHAATLSRMVAGTDFVPAALRNKPAAVAALMLLGHELGLGPMASLQGLTVTPTKTLDNGKIVGGDIITLSRTMRAIVRSHGHRMWPDPDEYTSVRVRWHGYRRDNPDHVMSVLFTLEDAKAAGLTATTGRPGAWQKHPRRMLSARASSELAILLDEDGLLGISYTAEEADDENTLELLEGQSSTTATVVTADEPQTAATPETGTRTRSTRRRAAVTASEPPQASPETHTPPEAGVGAAPTAPASVSLEVPGDSAIITPAQAEARAAAALETATGSHEALNLGRIPVPGDTVTGDGSGTALPPIDLEAADQEQAVHNAEDQATLEATTMPIIQRIAMLCREAGVDRVELVRHLTDGQHESAKALTPSMQEYALEHLRAVIRGEQTFHPLEDPPTGGAPFRDVDDLGLADKARAELAKLSGTPALRATLVELGWIEAEHGPVSAWLAQRSRTHLVTIIGAARAATAKPEEPA